MKIALICALAAQGACYRTRVVTVPIKVHEPCLEDLGPPPDVFQDDYYYLELWSRRAWVQCGVNYEN